MTAWIVVEDEPDLYDMVLAMYETMGIDGIAFADGEEVADWLAELDPDHSSEELPELALIDIRLPGELNGIDIGSKLRSSQVLKNMVIVLMTAYRLSPQEEKTAVARSSADMILYKPLPPIHEFRQMMTQLVASR